MSEFLGFGYNIAIRSVPKEKIVIDMINSGSYVHLIMCEPPNGIPQKQDFDELWWYYNQLYPIYGDKLTLIWRFYNRYEGNWRYYDSKVIQAVLNGVKLPPNTIIDSLCNEPNIGDSYLFAEQYVRHELNILRDLKAIGVKYAVGAFSTGTPNETFIERGLFDLLLQESEYMSVHLYNHFPFEAGEIVSWDIMNKTESNREWIRNTYFNKQQWSSDYRGWLFGRMGWWEQRCITLGIDMPQVFVTEAVFDFIDACPPLIRSNWSNDFGLVEYNKHPRGVLTWSSYFDWLFPDLTREQQLKMILLHVRKNVLYKDYIKGILLFGYNRNWDTPQGHNWENQQLNTFRLKHLKEVNMEVIQNPTDTSSKYDMIWSNKVSNVRTSPEIKDDNVSWFLTSEKESVTILQTINQNGYEWIKFLRHKDNEIYYVAKTGNLNIVDIEEIEEVKYAIDLLGMTQVVTSSQLQNLKELFESFKNFISEIDEEIEYDNDEYLIELFRDFLELRKEATDLERDLTVTFVDRIIQGIEKAQVI